MQKNTPVSLAPRPDQYSLEDWLVVAAGAVIFGDKTGELIPLNCRRWQAPLEECIAAARTTAEINGLQCRALCRCHSCARVLIYDEARLKHDLDRIPAWVWRRLGYSGQISLELFLKDLDRKWRRPSQIPHEIGLCLGYPLKDVLGYLNLINLPCTGCCGWRIYGRPATSLRRKQNFDKARSTARIMVQQRAANC